MSHEPDHTCGRKVGRNEIPLGHAGFDRVEITLLRVTRFFLQSFAIPQSQSWLMAFNVAEHELPKGASSEVVLELLAMIQAMRCSRRSTFHFNNPSCRGCASVLTEHERQFMTAFTAMRRGEASVAMTSALLLCEGNDANPMLERAARLIRFMDAPSEMAPALASETP
ncbi:hypothetical protein [Pontivivens ytuae]|uniref:Uncharacterized protein n=1 Tax=Pontivivens ytuae TaxID=2789856 RepID=A0A7S9LUK6_9RHOB|nr:hypothetical protein [Pontivivens ytuae]QPH55606.1 hypothetical protein I0K15_07700 [Pontivivens ytuae]